MKKMKRLFAVMMAILVIAGSLPVYSFAAQTEGEQPAQETVSEYAENGVSAAFTVTLDANGGTVDPASIVVTYDSAIGELPVPTKVKATFLGWYDAEGNEGTAETINTVDGDSTIAEE
mgnify:CR=1 FL=1